MKKTDESEDIARICSAVETASAQYFRLVLVAGLSGSGKSAALESVAKQLNCPLVNANLELSRKMLELTRMQRPRLIEKLLRDVVAAASSDVVVLDNLEILFDPALEIDPLRLLQGTSRNRTIVASWNGSIRDGTLTYAEPGHPEYVQFKQIDAVVIAVGTNETK